MNRKYTVAVFARSLDKAITGGARRRIEIANRLSQRGWDVTMYTFDATPMSPRWKPLELKVPLEKRVDGIKADFVICGDANEDPLETREGTFLTAQASQKKFWLMQIYRPKQQGKALDCPSIEKVANSTYMASLVRRNHKQKVWGAIGGVDTAFFYFREEPRAFRLLTFQHKSRVSGASSILKFQEIDNSQSQEDLRQRYWDCNVFVNLEDSLEHGWCNPIAEAMACGRACVSVDSPHVHDLIIHRKTGLLTSTKLEHIAEAVAQLKDEKFRQQIVKNGLEHIRQFDWERVVDGLERCLLGEHK